MQRLLAEISDLKRDIEYLEGQLQSSGTSRTADDVQGEIQKLGESMWVNSNQNLISYAKTVNAHQFLYQEGPWSTKSR